MGKDKSKKIIIRKQRCEPTSSSTQTIICSRTPSCVSDSSSVCDGCGEGMNCCSSSSSTSCSDPKMYLIEATKSSSSCSSSSSSDSCRKSSKESCNVVYVPTNGCNNNSQNSIYYNFDAIVRPVRNFALVDGRSCSSLKMEVSINGRSVTVQWEGFTGQVDASGQAYLYINQNFSGLPKRPIFGACAVTFKGGSFMSIVEVLPNNDNTIRWYLSPTMKGTNVVQGDAFTIYEGAISYIMSKGCC